MAGNPNYGNILSTSIDNFLAGDGDNYSAHSRGISYMKEKGRMITETGGNTLLEEVVFDGNGAGGWYAGSEKFSLINKQFLTSASYPWKQAYTTIVVNGMEEVINDGSSRMKNLISEKILSATRNLGNMLGGAFYSDGTNPKQLGGLQYLVSDTPNAGVVGGIDPSTTDNAFWRNFVLTDSLTNANVVGDFHKAITKATRNTDRPDVAFTDNSSQSKYYSALQAQQRFTNTDGKGGFTDLMIDGIAYINDQAMNGFCPTGHTYFLNTNMLKFRPNAKRNPKRKERVQSIDQDVYVETLLWAGNLTLKGRQFQAVVIDSSPTAY